MIGKIILSVICFLLFAYVFVFKLIKKNDTTYLIIIVLQAIGILLNFIHILFNVFNKGFYIFIVFLLNILIPCLVFVIEYKGLNFSELVSIATSRVLIFFGKTKKAKDLLSKLVAKYDKSYAAHKMLAEIYEQEGGMRKAIDEYIKVLDIRKDDYKSYFKITKLLRDLGKKEEAIQMLRNIN